MKISINKTVEIKSLDQWFHVAPPEGGTTQWKVGRSALEMARFAMSNEFPAVIEKVLKECNLKDSGFDCEPEALTSFEPGMGTGGPRHHDLLMIGKNTLIGVEAKVSEPFDKTIKDKRNRKDVTANMKLRLNSCLNYLYKTIPENADDLYYQLFSATIGTIIAAKNLKDKDIKNVISLFVVFTGNVDKEKGYDDHVRENEKAFKEFCNSFGLDENGGELPKIPGAPDIRCWIKKIHVDIGSFSYKKD